jgi:thiol-disulfide isomerase/thioredoxin
LIEIQLMKTIASFIVLVFVSFTSFAQDYIPDIQVETLDGEKQSIIDIVKNNGKEITIINFWATWCLPCRNELENIAEIYPDWVKDYNVELIAVSIDDARTKSQVNPYINSRGFEYRIVMDGNQEFFKMVNGITPPLTLVVDNTGKILEVEHGYIEGNEYILEDKLMEFTEK